MLTRLVSIGSMISTFKCSDTEALFNGTRVARFVNIQVVALRKLAMLNRAENLDDLRIPPNNRLEQLKRNRAGQWSIRVNDQWRLCFRFTEGQAYDVEIVDYH
jgi:proteic killer suppression protein